MNYQRIEERRRELDCEAVRIRRQIRRLAVKRAWTQAEGYALDLGILGLKCRTAFCAKEPLRWLPVCRLGRPEIYPFRLASEFTVYGLQSAG